MSHERYQVTISADGVGDVTAMMDADPSVIPSGYGGWVVVPRQRRVGLTIWQGKDPLRMKIPLLFDGFIDRAGQEVMISRLSRMALPPLAGGEPPQVTLDGNAVPQPGPKLWVIEGLDWGTNVLWDFAGNGVMARLRQDVVVNLLEYRADDRVAFGSLKPGVIKSGSSKSGWPKAYVAKAGDTFRSIASRFYGSPTKWQQIATANGLLISAKLKPGQNLKVPKP